MNNLPSCFRRGPALHQMVQGQGVVNPRDRRLPLGLFPGQPPGRRAVK
jgi:hypothetical protein